MSGRRQAGRPDGSGRRRVGRPTIRLAGPADLEQLVELRLTLLSETGDLRPGMDEAGLEAALRAYLAEAVPSGRFVAWVAVADGRLVATSGMVFFERVPYPDNPSGLEAYVMNMYTAPAWRRQGLAAILLERLLDTAKEKGARRVWLTATDEGRPLYLRRGFSGGPPELELRW